MTTVSSIILIAASVTTLEVQRPISRVVQVTSQGPQGPQGQGFISNDKFNNTAIGALTSGDIGKVLEWDGALFTPTNELDTGLTITGGAF